MRKAPAFNLCVPAVPSPLPPPAPTKKGKLPGREEPSCHQRDEDVGAETTQRRERWQLETLNPLGRKTFPPSLRAGRAMSNLTHDGITAHGTGMELDHL